MKKTLTALLATIPLAATLNAAHAQQARPADFYTAKVINERTHQEIRELTFRPSPQDGTTYTHPRLCLNPGQALLFKPSTKGTGDDVNKVKFDGVNFDALTYKWQQLDVETLNTQNTNLKPIKARITLSRCGTGPRSQVHIPVVKQTTPTRTKPVRTPAAQAEEPGQQPPQESTAPYTPRHARVEPRVPTKEAHRKLYGTHLALGGGATQFNETTRNGLNRERTFEANGTGWYVDGALSTLQKKFTADIRALYTTTPIEEKGTTVTNAQSKRIQSTLNIEGYATADVLMGVGPAVQAVINSNEVKERVVKNENEAPEQYSARKQTTAYAGGIGWTLDTKAGRMSAAGMFGKNEGHDHVLARIDAITPRIEASIQYAETQAGKLRPVDAQGVTRTFPIESKDLTGRIAVALTPYASVNYRGQFVHEDGVQARQTTRHYIGGQVRTHLLSGR